MDSAPYPLILDTKHELRWKDYRVTSSISQALRDTPAIFRPHDGIRGRLDIRILLSQVYKRGGYSVYIDEVFALGGRNFQHYPEELDTLLTRGRSRGISIYTGTQRPVFIPKFCFTESRHIFVFALGDDDRKHLARVVGIPKLADPLTGHKFYYFNREKRSVVEDTLRGIDVKAS